MGLNIIIVGAGIGGLCAAVSLRQAGHSITVFEKSRFATEIGAALVVSCNGSRVLSHLGFSFPNARGCHITAWGTLDGENLEKIGNLDLVGAEKRYGAPLMTVHRVDLHNELYRLASTEDIAGDVRKVSVRLDSRVTAADAEAGTVTLADGTVHHADLIIAADGYHSVMKEVVLGEAAPTGTPTGLDAFRFLIQTKDMLDEPQTVEFLSRKFEGPTILANPHRPTSDSHLVWYDCRGGEVQNFVGIVPSHPDDATSAATEDHKDFLLQEFSHFHPNLIRTLEKAPEVTCWPLSAHDPLPRWQRGKIVLIGDAAHPVLPYGGQGSNQAIEDAGALGSLFDGVENPDEISRRLDLFEVVRKQRASRVQVVSSVRIGKEMEVHEKLKQYADPPGSAVPKNFAERNAHDYGFDVYKRCAEVLQASS